MTQLLYVGLHLKPLAPLTSRSSPVDEIFLRQFTTGRYFASELFLLWLLAFASPIRLILLSSFQTSCVFSSRYLRAHVGVVKALREVVRERKQDLLSVHAQSHCSKGHRWGSCSISCPVHNPSNLL